MWHDKLYLIPVLHAICNDWSHLHSSWNHVIHTKSSVSALPPPNAFSFFAWITWISGSLDDSLFSPGLRQFCVHHFLWYDWCGQNQNKLMSKPSFFRALSSELDPKGHNYQIQKYGTKIWGIWTVTPSFMTSRYRKNCIWPGLTEWLNVSCFQHV